VPNVRVYDTGRIVRRVPLSGIQVVEYTEQPGVYYTVTGDVIPEDSTWPQEARFDVRKSRMEKRRRELMVDAQKNIDEQMAEEEAGVEAKIESEEAERAAAPAGADTTQDEERVEKGSLLKATHRGGGRYRVADAAGEIVADGLSKGEANQFISDAAAAEEEEATSGG
jgi:hypothetical protein